VMLNGDGTVNVVVGATDLTGTNTSFAQIAAEVLDLPVSRVSVTTADTKSAPYAGVTGGSKTLFTVGQAVQAAAQDARQQILALVAKRLEAATEDLEIEDGEVRIKGSPDRSITFERLGQLTTAFMSPYSPIVGRGTVAPLRQAPGFTAQVAEVEVDADTGQVRVVRYVTVQDAGFAINPLSVEGQMQGGTSQGIGVALSEQMVYDEKGRLLNANLLDYRMPTSADVPPIETVIVEVPSEGGPYGARGVGEPSIVATSAAIGNAIYDAIGVRVCEAPITAERILRAAGRIRD
ncbi:MAG: molybdopterin-dependent oxidoreductase, partial [Chloroflexota bacterium]|nr:molybdopterin-dependent oxidoreductase [Chloroflexota bacterium]